MPERSTVNARNDSAARHNAALLPVLRHAVDLIGNEPGDLLVFAESFVVGLFLLIVRLGGDEPVLEAFTERVRERLAEQRLGRMPEDYPQ
jgi:hypothetical protein